MYRYRKLQQDVSKMLKDHYYSFTEVMSIVGCGNKTLRRYIDKGILKPVTSGSYSNSQYFTSEELERAQFVYDLQKSTKAPIEVSAAIYDYLKAKRMRFDLQNLLDRIEDYRSNY